MHPLRSPFVRDQLCARARRLNEKAVAPGEFVLYWMQSTRRTADNWALRYAILEADRLARPLIVLHELSPACGTERVYDEPMGPTARHWHFLLDGTADLAADAGALGIPYLFVFHPRTGQLAVGTVAPRACLIVTDDHPVGGSARRAVQLAALAHCPVVAVESTCVVPASLFPLEEYSPRTFRPKVMQVLDQALEPVESRGPKHEPSAALLRSLVSDLERAPVPIASLTRPERTALVESASLDQAVPAVAAVPGGRHAALAQLRQFLAHGLGGYAARWTGPLNRTTSSRLSPYLRWGQISSADVAREVRAHGSEADATAFLDGLVVSRELAFNSCLRAPSFTTLSSLPEWAHRSMERHGHDRRPHAPDARRIDAGDTGLSLWDAAQRELRETGTLPQHLRQLWGKSLILMTPSYAEAHRTLLRLNTRYALDGGDASTYASALWCFGKYDRPFKASYVWGHIRPMSLERHAKTAAARSYLAASASGESRAGRILVAASA